jgi:hypothetical protein
MKNFGFFSDIKKTTPSRWQEHVVCSRVYSFGSIAKPNQTTTTKQTKKLNIQTCHDSMSCPVAEICHGDRRERCVMDYLDNIRMLSNSSDRRYITRRRHRRVWMNKYM